MGNGKGEPLVQRACAQRMSRKLRPAATLLHQERHGMIMLSTGRREDVSRWGLAHPVLPSPPTPGIHRFTAAGLRHGVVRLPATAHPFGKVSSWGGARRARCCYLTSAAGPLWVVAASVANAVSVTFRSGLRV